MSLLSRPPVLLIPRIPFNNKFACRRHTSSSNLYSIANVLNEENLQKAAKKFAIMRTPTVKQQTAQMGKSTRKAAILIPLCIVEGKVSLLYTLRAASLNSHRGQVSFPGGVQDAIDDASYEATALRETHEEIGIGADEFRIWGRGNEVLASNGRTRVLPIIGQLRKGVLDVERLVVNRHEVDDVFAVALQDLCDPRWCGHTQFRGAYSVPVYVGGKRRIWGFTAYITHMFLTALLPAEAYHNRVKYINFGNKSQCK